MQRTITMADGSERTVTFERLGVYGKPPHGELLDTHANGDTGMEYEFYAHADDAEATVYVAACHEDVGLVTWYQFANADDAYLETGAY